MRARANATLLWGLAAATWLLASAGVLAAEEGPAPAASAVDQPGVVVVDPPPEPPRDLEALIREIEDMYRSESSRSRVALSITKPRRTRRLEMQVWTQGEDKALIVIESPARERGTATLKVGRNLWNYLPRIRRTIRIPPSMMLSSWMGTDFTNDDLVQESSLRRDYTCEVVGRSEDPDNGWLLRLEAKPDIVGLWQRIDFVVTLGPVLPVRAAYYDRKGRLARTMYWDELTDFDGRQLPARMTLIPEDPKQKGQKTEMRYLDIKLNVDVPDSTFSLSALERKR